MMKRCAIMAFVAVLLSSAPGGGARAQQPPAQQPPAQQPPAQQPSAQQPPAPKANLLEIADNLNIQSDSSETVVDPKTNDLQKAVFTGNVRFAINEAVMFCDRVEITQESAAKKTVLNAFPAAGMRDVIYLYDRSLMAICDHFTHYPDDKTSLLTSKPKENTLVYYVRANGSVMKQICRKMSITQSDTAGTRMETDSQQSFPIEPNNEKLPATLKKRLTEFLAEVQKRRAAQAQAAPAGAQTGANQVAPSSSKGSSAPRKSAAGAAAPVKGKSAAKTASPASVPPAGGKPSDKGAVPGGGASGGAMPGASPGRSAQIEE